MDETGADICPRCGGAFHCGYADAAPCACTALHLDQVMRAQLRLRYRGCLCLRCLATLATEGTPTNTPTSAPATP